MSQPFGGLYLHVPFCSRVCPYCDFAVRTGNAERHRRYYEALLDEIKLAADDTGSRAFGTFDTIYFGGGTPSILESEALCGIVGAVQAAFPFTEDRRIFMEANPEDVTHEAVEAWREIGVTTLSLGIQSLEDRGLQFLGRSHDLAEAENAVRLAKGGGFQTVSIDLIYGRPGQTLEGWREEIDRATALGPDHISCYQLTIHQKTRFGVLVDRGRLVPVDNDTQGEFFRLTHRTFADAGLPAYEVSQFCGDDRHRSRHNMKYWDHTPYLGLGPSAHSFDGRERWWNERNMTPWETKLLNGERPIEARETLSSKERALEILMLGFRTAVGVDSARLRKETGLDPVEGNEDLLDALQMGGLLTLEGDFWIPTLEGLAVADSLAVRFRLA